MQSTEKVRVTKRFTFEMAHALRCHDGLCANIHGHSYVLDVTLLGTPIHAPGHPKDGMVIDFLRVGVGDLRTGLDRRLPEFMVPSVVVPLATVPRLPNGKIDPTALPDPFLDGRNRSEGVEPRTDAERPADWPEESR